LLLSAESFRAIQQSRPLCWRRGWLKIRTQINIEKMQKLGNTFGCAASYKDMQ
jgi:hypothetical protein